MSHLIKPEDLQHHGTLFAGRMAEWLVEACFIASSRFVGQPEDIVCVQVHGIHFKKPANNGDIVEIRSKIACIGGSSITVHGRAFVNEDKMPAVLGMVTFVTVDKSGKPYAHRLSLPSDYIRQNRELYEEALKLRARDKAASKGTNEHRRR